VRFIHVFQSVNLFPSFIYFFRVIVFLQECVENLFLSLSAALQTPENQDAFLECEGFELMMRCLKEQQYAAGCAIPALSYAVAKNKSACERLVDAGGLKYVFPLLSGGGLKHALKRKGSGEKRNIEESAISIVAQLCTLLCAPVSEKHYAQRLLNKLAEKEHEKLERCAELHGKYTRALLRTEARLEEEGAAVRERGDEDEIEEFENEDTLYSKVRFIYSSFNRHV
jgi:hypothetical protein